MPPVDSPVSQMRAALVAARNADGGWPYYAGKSSRVEPTAVALLALGLPVDVLERWPRRNGLLVDAAGSVNVAFNGVAALPLAADASGAVARDLVQALVAARAVPLPRSTVNRQDDSIRAWSWTDGTFSWVESTAWCLLGLKKLSPAPRSEGVTERMHDGERLLADRVCRGGGWNHGNSNMLGTELPPYVPNTALALLALHDRPRESYVTSSLAYLDRARLAERGAFALPMTRICLGVYDRPADDVSAAIGEEWNRSRFLGNMHATALAVYALTAAPGFEAFRV